MSGFSPSALLFGLVVLILVGCSGEKSEFEQQVARLEQLHPTPAATKTATPVLAPTVIPPLPRFVMTQLAVSRDEAIHVRGKFQQITPYWLASIEGERVDLKLHVQSLGIFFCQGASFATYPVPPTQTTLGTDRWEIRFSLYSVKNSPGVLGNLTFEEFVKYAQVCAVKVTLDERIAYGTNQYVTGFDVDLAFVGR